MKDNLIYAGLVVVSGKSTYLSLGLDLKLIVPPSSMCKLNAWGVSIVFISCVFVIFIFPLRLNARHVLRDRLNDTTYLGSGPCSSVLFRSEVDQESPATIGKSEWEMEMAVMCLLRLLMGCFADMSNSEVTVTAQESV